MQIDCRQWCCVMCGAFQTTSYQVSCLTKVKQCLLMLTNILLILTDSVKLVCLHRLLYCSHLLRYHTAIVLNWRQSNDWFFFFFYYSCNYFLWINKKRNIWDIVLYFISKFAYNLSYSSCLSHTAGSRRSCLSSTYSQVSCWR